MKSLGGTLTVNLPNYDIPEYHAFVDTNNFGAAEEFIKERGIGKPTGETGMSGMCVYPLYRFFGVELEKYDSEGCKKYEELACKDVGGMEMVL